MPKPVVTELVGGTEGEPERGASLPYFFPGVKAVKFNEKNVYGCRILPAFDPAIKGQDGYDTSYIPYRRSDVMDTQLGVGIFSSWYFVIQTYQFLGNEGRGFTSPLTGSKNKARGIDPLYDCFLTARNSENSEWKELVKKGTTRAEGFNAILQDPKAMGLLNVYMALKEGDEMGNFIGVVNKAAIDDLKAQLNMLRPARVQEIVSPEYPDFLYGDVTDPINGLWSTVKKAVFNTAGMTTPCFSFSQVKEVLRGHTKWPIDPAQEWGAGVLAGRYKISDVSKVTKIHSAEEILDYAVSDGFLPYDLIQKACGERWAVPAQSTNPEYTFGAEESNDPMPGEEDFAPQPEAAPEAAPAPAPVAPVAPRVAPVAPKAAPAQKVAAPVNRPAAPVAKPAAPVGRPAASARTAAPAPGAPPPARTAASTARPAAPTARPTAPAPGTPPTGRPAAPVGRPAAPVRPTAPPLSTRLLPTQPPVAPAPAPAEEPAPAPAEAASGPPLTQEEYTRMTQLEQLVEGDPNSVSGPEMQEMLSLAQRATDNNQR